MTSHENAPHQDPTTQHTPDARSGSAVATQDRQPHGSTVFGAGREANELHLPDLLRSETVGGLVMLAATIAALVVANLAPNAYQHLLHVELGPLSVHEWAADGLLTLFFFAAGLELKRELTEGSLSRPKDALLPIVAALGGMVVPALVYLLVNGVGGGSSSGWAIPMATDIAFALAVLAVVGSELPSGLRAFLLTLAIVDDLGAILVIATVFTSGIKVGFLLGSVACIAAWWLAMRARLDVRLPAGWLLFAVLGVAAWWLMLNSGVHATIAGVALGLATRSVEDEMDDPTDRWQHRIAPWSAGLVVPVFAFTSAGLHVDGTMLHALVSRPEAIGVGLGLVLGKAVGVFAGAWLTARLTSATLAEHVRWRDVACLASLCGVGFTVSLLMTDLAFPASEELATDTKAAVLAGSLVAAIIGGVTLRHRNKRHAEASR